MRDNSKVATRVIRILVADDSIAVQEFLRELCDDEPDMLVVGTARNGIEVVQLARSLKPDLITMDADMPILSGVEATRRIMSECPTPIALVTAAPVGPGSDLTFHAVAAGAVEAFSKPRRQELQANPAIRDSFLRQLRNVAYVKVVGRRGTHGARARGLKKESELSRELLPTAQLKTPGLMRSPRLIAIGASTGGPPALKQLLSQLDPETTPPIALVQHMSEDFLPGFAAWLDTVVQLKVKVAENGVPMRPGHVYVAAGERHLIVSGGRLGLIHGAPVQYQRPSVDVLFDSVARNYGQDAVGILLTGMGRDGADGMLSMFQKGALTITQDADSCLVYGMPRAANELGASRISTTPSHMTQLIRHMVRKERQVG